MHCKWSFAKAIFTFERVASVNRIEYMIYGLLCLQFSHGDNDHCSVIIRRVNIVLLGRFIWYSTRAACRDYYRELEHELLALYTAFALYHVSLLWKVVTMFSCLSLEDYCKPAVDVCFSVAFWHRWHAVSGNGLFVFHARTMASRIVDNKLSAL